ncbi:hypothetical protein A2U01_0091921, partial [Trifolium medium]|nr:hypothetical protein [Trifolium medium]
MKPSTSRVLGTGSPTCLCGAVPQLKRRVSSWKTRGEVRPFSILWSGARLMSSEDM